MDKPLVNYKINRAVPMSYQTLRREATRMMAETVDVQVKDGDRTRSVTMSRLHAILRKHADQAMDGDHKSAELFLTCAFGKHPQPVDGTQVELLNAISGFTMALRRVATTEEMGKIIEVIKRLPKDYEPALCESNGGTDEELSPDK